MAKAIFTRVFNHLVRCINRALSLPATSSAPPSPRRAGRTTPAFAEEEEAQVQESEDAETRAEAAAVAEAEAEAAEEDAGRTRGADSAAGIRLLERCTTRRAALTVVRAIQNMGRTRANSAYDVAGEAAAVVGALP